MVRTSPRRDTRYGASTTRRRKSATRRSNSLKNRVKSKFKFAKSKPRLATASNRRAQAYKNAYRSSSKETAHGMSSTGTIITKKLKDEQTTTATTNLTDTVFNTEGMIDSICDQIMTSPGYSISTLYNLSLVNKNIGTLTQNHICSILNVIKAVLNNKKCSNEDYGTINTMIRQCPNYKAFQYVHNHYLPSEQYALGDIEWTNKVSDFNGKQEDEEYNELGMHDADLDKATEPVRSFLLDYDFRLKVATCAALYEANENAAQTERKKDIFSMICGYWSPAYCESVWNSKNPRTNFWRTINRKIQPQMRYVSIATMLCDVFEKYKVIDIVFIYSFIGIMEVVNFQLTPFQERIVTFLRTHESIKYQIVLAFKIDNLFNPPFLNANFILNSFKFYNPTEQFLNIYPKLRNPPNETYRLFIETNMQAVQN